MQTTVLKQLIRVWSRQGLLQGDLNHVQQYCLAWTLSDEQEENYGQMKLGVLASNPEVYKAVFERDEQEEPEWITPMDEDEAADMMAQIEQWQQAKERF